MPDSYRFHCPVKVVSGKNVLDKLPSEFSQLESKHPIIVTDPGVANAGLLDIIHTACSGNGLNLSTVYDQVPADSPISAILGIVDAYRRNDCDGILAVGGGSAIDTAKAVGIKLADESVDLMSFKSVLRMTKQTPPLIVVPTTAGTGSEVTSAAVISYPDNGIKLSLLSPSMPPNTAVVDPRMTLTLPPRITAATGMDALTHAIEACLGTHKNPISDAIAEEAISLISGNLVEAVQNGQNLEARLAMANAATLAGIAFSNSMVTMVHALGHSLGAIHHVPHGEAVAVCLPDALEFNMDTVGGYLADLLLPMAGAEEFINTPMEKRPIRFIEKIRDMRKTLHELSGLPITLKDAGVGNGQLEEVAEISPKDGAAYYNRKKFSSEDALHVLKKM